MIPGHIDLFFVPILEEAEAMYRQIRLKTQPDFDHAWRYDKNRELINTTTVLEWSRKMYQRKHFNWQETDLFSE